MSIEKICQFCQKKYSIRPYENKRSKFCSRVCANTVNARENAKIKHEKFQNIDYLKSRIVIDKKTGCWNWQGSKGRQGYGVKRIGDRLIKTHRLFYELLVGKIKKNKKVCHKCDNPSCCNPEHLFIGTQRKNMQDMMKKNRSNFHRGENNKLSIFKNEEVIEIRKLYPSITQAELARRYKCSEGAIASIIHRRTWKHIE